MRKNAKKLLFSSNLQLPSRAYKCTPGNCDVTTGNALQVYLVDQGIGYVPVVGDYIYTDEDLTIPYNSSQYNRLAHPGNPSFNKTYTLSGSTAGLIVSVDDCPPVPGESASVISENGNSCTSCMQVTVTVPTGETRTINMVKNGAAPYLTGSSECGVGLQTIADIINQEISTTTTYLFGLDAAVGNGLSESTITFTVTGETPIVLTRSHQFPIVSC